MPHLERTKYLIKKIIEQEQKGIDLAHSVFEGSKYKSQSQKVLKLVLDSLDGDSEDLENLLKHKEESIMFCKCLYGKFLEEQSNDKI